MLREAGMIFQHYDTIYIASYKTQNVKSGGRSFNFRKIKDDTLYNTAGILNNKNFYIYGDGEQTRDWTHVNDIARANLLSAKSSATGVFDICTGIQTTMNEIAKYFKCPIDYVQDQLGDTKHLSINQDPKPALEAFAYKYAIPLNYESMKVYL